jgi:hypothetical protein
LTKHIRWRRAALQYGCTQCGAPPGRPCVTVDDKIKYEIHTVRSRLASADHWEIEENAMHICPDCRDGKHGACINQAWDPVTEQTVPCDCYRLRHQGTEVPDE